MFLFEVSIVKSLLLSIRLFGYTKGMKLPALVSKHATVKIFKGAKVQTKFQGFGTLRFGFTLVGTYNQRYFPTLILIKGVVKFKGRCVLGSGARVSVDSGATLEIGNQVRVNATSHILVRKEVIIGDDTLISWDISITDSDFHKVLNYDCDKEKTIPVRIGAKCWIGFSNIILKGTTIGNNCVVAAGSILSNGHFGNSVLIAGSPAKEIRKIKGWEE